MKGTLRSTPHPQLFIIDLSKMVVLLWFSVTCLFLVSSVNFHLMCVLIIFSLAWVAEWWVTFGEIAAHSVDHMFSLYFDCL